MCTECVQLRALCAVCMHAHVHSACACLLHVCVSTVCARDHPGVLNRGGQASAGGAQPPPCACVTLCHPLCPQGSSASGRRTGACSTTPACTEAPARATPASALRATPAPTASTVSVGTWGGTGDTWGHVGTCHLSPSPSRLQARRCQSWTGTGRKAAGAVVWSPGVPCTHFPPF